MPRNFSLSPADQNAVLTKGVKAEFYKIHGELMKQAGWQDLCMMLDSNNDSEVYPWLGDLPIVREWLGPRQAGDLAGGDFTIKNKLYESTMAIKRTELDDNKMGGVKLRIRGMAAQMAAHPEAMVMQFLAGAVAAGTHAAAPYLCHDGQGLFDADHPAPVDPDPLWPTTAVQVNYEAVALTSANLWLAIEKMMMFRDTKNRPMGIVPNVLMVEPCLAEMAMKLCLSAFHADSAVANVGNSINGLKEFKIKVIVAPALYSTSTIANANWILACTNHPSGVKPVIYQERDKVEFSAQEKDSENGFELDEYRYGTRARGNVGAGLWFLVYGSSGAA
ncbi:MAG TPA: Mu-like prophage major head subunit gpT family protein [Armatimonadota bacterium]|nr:Mu-like prophage major head subunit gpT family protein [Armatimonadota bacterium]